MNTLIVIVGPTGIGKTDLGVFLAQKLNTEIISADSRQFYKELKIGTAVPTEKQLAEAKHYFIGNISIHEYYNASIYEFAVIELLNTLFTTKELVILLGGSGMYIDAVCNGIDDLPDIDTELRLKLQKKYEDEGVEGLRFELKRLDPEYYSIVDLKNPKRILKGLEVCMMTGKTYTSYRKAIKKNRNFNILKIGLNINRSELYKSIDNRVDRMIDEGLISEARTFYSHKNINALNTVGYKELFDYFDGLYDLNKAIELIKRNSRRYAKRQISWFMRDKDINWFEPMEKDNILEWILKQKI
jgi:tRNA dimethylallyltransferase